MWTYGRGRVGIAVRIQRRWCANTAWWRQAASPQDSNSSAIKSRSSKSLTRDSLPISPIMIALPLSRKPLFPGQQAVLTITHPKVQEAIISRINTQPYLALFHRKSEPGPKQSPEVVLDPENDIYHTGTLAQIVRSTPVITSQISSEFSIFIHAHRRLDFVKALKLGPPMEVEVSHWLSTKENKVPANDPVVRATMNEVLEKIREITRISPLFKESLQMIIPQLQKYSGGISEAEPGKLADFAVSLVSSGESSSLMSVLTEANPLTRLEIVLDLLHKELQVAQMQVKIQERIEDRMGQQQKEFFLRQQLKSIKQELGLEKDDKEAILQKYKERIEDKVIPKEAKEAKPHPIIHGSTDTKDGKVKLRAAGTSRDTEREEEPNFAVALSTADVQRKKKDMLKEKLKNLKTSSEKEEKTPHRRRENATPSSTMMADEYDRKQRVVRINPNDVDQRKTLEQREAIRQEEEREAQTQQQLERRRMRFQKMESAEAENIAKKAKIDKKPTIRIKPKENTVACSPEPKRLLSPPRAGDVGDESEKKPCLDKEMEEMERDKYLDELKAKLMEGRNKTRNQIGADTSQSTVTQVSIHPEKNESPPSAAVKTQATRSSEKKVPICDTVKDEVKVPLPSSNSASGKEVPTSATVKDEVTESVSSPSEEKKVPTSATAASPVKDVLKTPLASPKSKKVVVKSPRGAANATTLSEKEMVHANATTSSEKKIEPGNATTSSSKKVEPAKEFIAPVSNLKPTVSKALTAPTPAAPTVSGPETMEPVPATSVAQAAPDAQASPASPPSSASAVSQRVKPASSPSRAGKPAPLSAPVKPSPASESVKAAPPTALRPNVRAVTATAMPVQLQSEAAASLTSTALPTTSPTDVKTNPSVKKETANSATVQKSISDPLKTDAPDASKTNAANASNAKAPDALTTGELSTLKTVAPKILQLDAPQALQAELNANTPAAEREHRRVENGNPVDSCTQPNIKPRAEDTIVEPQSAPAQPQASNSEPSGDKVAERTNTTLPRAQRGEDKGLSHKADANTVLSNCNKPTAPSDAPRHNGGRTMQNNEKTLKSPCASDKPGALSTRDNTPPDAKPPPPRLVKPSGSQGPRQATQPSPPSTQAAERTASTEQKKFQFTPIVFKQKTSQPSVRSVSATKPDTAKQSVARKTPSDNMTSKTSQPSSGDAPQSPKAASSAAPVAAARAKAAVPPEKVGSIPTGAQSRSAQPAVAKETVAKEGCTQASQDTKSVPSEPISRKTKVSQKAAAPPAKVDGASAPSAITTVVNPANAENVKTGGAKTDPARQLARSSKAPVKVGTKADGSPQTPKSAPVTGIKRKERPADDVESAQKRLETESLWAKYNAELTELEESLLKMRPDLISHIEEELVAVSRDFADPAAFDRELDRLESLL